MKPALQELGDDRIALVKIAVRHCLLPHPDTVSAFPNAVFPSVRDAKKRGQTDIIDGTAVIYDDNTTPRWAILWTHGIQSLPRGHGWTFAHVWERANCKTRPYESYTNLANICMLPEFLSSLSDKRGPLAPYLRYHSLDRYGWKPIGAEIEKPEFYDELEWQYLTPVTDPKSVFSKAFSKSRDKRAIALRLMMSANLDSN